MDLKRQIGWYKVKPKGDVYIIAYYDWKGYWTVCGFLAEFTDDYFDEIGECVMASNNKATEALHLPVVSKQRELLIGYSKFLGLAEHEHTQELVNDDIDEYLANL